ncbi:hypothetical protein MCI89_24730 [Muricomes sp. OA1]|uniref:hypothetical protein n=1 Tax=Muricomes sp. OA1 TaxID=2914165 RepID=UPI001F0661AD|nr:hypothetical protein [Muricomes sp. OA1]MCH1975546.1 hypothetical protein [Muricomes sp. OA1]
MVNGTIQPSGTTEVKWGGSQTYTYEPSSGFVLKSVIVDGQDVTASNPGSYTFNNVTAPHNIKVTYQVDFSGFAVSGIEKEYDGNPIISVSPEPPIQQIRSNTGITENSRWAIQALRMLESIR